MVLFIAVLYSFLFHAFDQHCSFKVVWLHFMEYTPMKWVGQFSISSWSGWFLPCWHMLVGLSTGGSILGISWVTGGVIFIDLFTERIIWPLGSSLVGFRENGRNLGSVWISARAALILGDQACKICVAAQWEKVAIRFPGDVDTGNHFMLCQGLGFRCS